jgi:ribonucleoside-diphosphate reductase alpha subunit
MEVVKRDGTCEPVRFDTISDRLRTLSLMNPPLQIDIPKLAITIIEQLHDKISTSKIDELSAEECAAKCTEHPDFGVLAGRIVISNNHKNTSSCFFSISEQLYTSGRVHDDYFRIVGDNFPHFQEMLQFDRDYLIDYFGFKTLERAYLLKCDDVIVERPQHMWMRVAVAIHGANLDKVKETYDLMSQKYFTHATPTLFNAGTPLPQLSSCFLVGMQEDSIDGIYDTLKDCALISKLAGGIGLHIHNVRGTGTHIQGTNGKSNGIVPMLRVFNETARYVDQGGGKRNGSFAIYLSPDHSDIEAWIDLKRNTGDESAKARDLFYGLWVPDLFMSRVEQDADWSLFCPHDCPGLSLVYGDTYKELYETYEREGKASKTVKARELWFKILDAQMETGTPSILYKDACNHKSNQKNIGVIQSSNLCTEIIQYSDKEETAVCNLASISLTAFVKNKTFNFEELHRVTQVVVENLNRIIDLNHYPTEKARRSNMRHRPIGTGVQGLADAFFLMDIPFHSPAALELNQQIFETMYHAAMTKSVELARRDGPYSTFAGSPLSEGKFQFDLWGVTPKMYDWTELRTLVQTVGVRNSLLLAPMPTASTSQILGNTECFEPITSNIYTRRTLAGDFVMVNQYLVNDLLAEKKWSIAIKDSIVANHGSVQHLDISDHLKQKYKVVWEMPMKHLIDLAVSRGAFICQSQSLNLWIKDPTYTILTSMYFYGWRQGLKTGVYYLRRKPKHHTTQFTIAPCETCSA